MCKPSSHKTLGEYLTGAELDSLTETQGRGAEKRIHRYRWMADVPLRDGDDALLVNWLVTVTDQQRAAVTLVRHLIWWFYHDIKLYRATPSAQAKGSLKARFDRIFSRSFGFDDLDQALVRLKARKSELLVVLDRPEVPLNTNISEQETLFPIPPYSPELNPVENIWEFLRGNKLAIQVWDDYEAIVNSCCNAWNWLMGSRAHRLAGEEVVTQIDRPQPREAGAHARQPTFGRGNLAVLLGRGRFAIRAGITLRTDYTADQLRV